MEEEEIKIKNEKVEKEKSKTQFIFKIVSVIIVVFLIIGLVIIKYNNPIFPMWLFIVLGVFLLLVGLLGWFGFGIFRKFQEKNEVIDKLKKFPSPANLSELMFIARNALTDKHYCNHTNGCVGHRFVTVGKSNKNVIFVYKTEALYKEGMNKGIIYVIINAHYPYDRYTILIDPTDYEVNKAIKDVATEHEQEPDIEEITTVNPTLGITTTMKKITPKKDEKKIEDNKKELE